MNKPPQLVKIHFKEEEVNVPLSLSLLEVGMEVEVPREALLEVRREVYAPRET